MSGVILLSIYDSLLRGDFEQQHSMPLSAGCLFIDKSAQPGESFSVPLYCDRVRLDHVDQVSL